MALSSTKLDRLLTLKSPSTTQSSSGEYVTSYAAAGTAWASWAPMSIQSREYQASMVLNAETSGIFRIRFRTDIRPTWRIILAGVTYEILSITEVERRAFLDIVVKSVSETVTGTSVSPNAA